MSKIDLIKKKELFIPMVSTFMDERQEVWLFSLDADNIDLNFWSKTVLTCPNHHQFVEQLYDYPIKHTKERDKHGRMLLTEWYVAKCPKCFQYFPVKIESVLPKEEAENPFNREDGVVRE